MILYDWYEDYKLVASGQPSLELTRTEWCPEGSLKMWETTTLRLNGPQRKDIEIGARFIFYPRGGILAIAVAK